MFSPNVQRMENISILTIKSSDEGDDINWLESHSNEKLAYNQVFSMSEFHAFFFHCWVEFCLSGWALTLNHGIAIYPSKLSLCRRNVLNLKLG